MLRMTKSVSDYIGERQSNLQKAEIFLIFSKVAMLKKYVWTLPFTPLVTSEKYKKGSTVVTQFGTCGNQFGVWKVSQCLWTTKKGRFLWKNIASSFNPSSQSNSNDIEYLDFVKNKYFYLFKDIRYFLTPDLSTILLA